MCKRVDFDETYRVYTDHGINHSHHICIESDLWVLRYGRTDKRRQIIKL